MSGPSAGGLPPDRPPSLLSWLTLRGRLALVATVAVAVGVAGVAAFGYVAVRHELVSEVDRQLQDQVEDARRNTEISAVGIPVLRLRVRFGEPGGYLQAVTDDGRVHLPEGQPVELPVDEEVREVAAGSREAFYRDSRIGDDHVRTYTAPLVDGVALQVALPLAAVDQELTRLGWLFLLTGLGGIALAAGLGWLVARTTLTPVARLTMAAEHVTATRDLALRIEHNRTDELGRLAASFNTMLDALQRSTEAQRRLVADASHELRTPLTSLRTNVEVLGRAESLPVDERRRVLRGVVANLEELTGLVSDIVELARGEEPAAMVEEFRLDALVAHAVARAAEHWPAVTFTGDYMPTLVRGVPARVERAVANLLDNAAKFSPPGGRVEVWLREGELVVRDHGAGIPPEDLPHVFDRFYRSTRDRELPGSGLGLAIVRQVAESHHGTVRAEAAAGGGTLMRLWLPARPPP